MFVQYLVWSMFEWLRGFYISLCSGMRKRAASSCFSVRPVASRPRALGWRRCPGTRRERALGGDASGRRWGAPGPRPPAAPGAAVPARICARGRSHSAQLPSENPHGGSLTDDLHSRGFSRTAHGLFPAQSLWLQPLSKQLMPFSLCFYSSQYLGSPLVRPQEWGHGVGSWGHIVHPLLFHISARLCSRLHCAFTVFSHSHGAVISAMINIFAFVISLFGMASTRACGCVIFFKGYSHFSKMSPSSLPVCKMPPDARYGLVWTTNSINCRSKYIQFQTRF